MAAAKTAKKKAQRRREQQDIVADARRVLGLYSKNKKAFVAADAGKEKKALPPAVVAQLRANVAQAKTATGGQTARKDAVIKATATEVKARVALREMLTGIRDDVRNSYPDDGPLQRAFGVGKKWNDKETTPLLDSASDFLEAYADKDNAKAAKAAGVTAAKMKKLQTLHDALADADTTQNLGVSARRTGTVTTHALLKAIEHSVAQIRRVARSVFKKQPDILKQFVSTLPPAKPRKRKGPPGGGPPPGAPPAGTT